MEHVYILHEREFIRLKENVYKIGRTKQKPHQRFNGYPKGSIPIYTKSVYDCLKIENIILSIFKKRYIQKLEYGTEYFEGDHNDMINQINEIIIKYDIYEIQNNNIHIENDNKYKNNPNEVTQENKNDTSVCKTIIKTSRGRKCPRCKVTFKKKSTFDYHIKRINKCDIVQEVELKVTQTEISNENNKKYICKHCKKFFQKNGI